jgi:hypothetical protein
VYLIEIVGLGIVTIAATVLASTRTCHEQYKGELNYRISWNGWIWQFGELPTAFRGYILPP